MFDDLLDEFTKDQWGVKLDHLKSVTRINKFSFSKLTKENIGNVERINDMINRTKDVVSNYKKKLVLTS